MMEFTATMDALSEEKRAQLIEDLFGSGNQVIYIEVDGNTIPVCELVKVDSCPEELYQKVIKQIFGIQ